VSIISQKYSRLYHLTELDNIPQWKDHFDVYLQATKTEILETAKALLPLSIPINAEMSVSLTGERLLTENPEQIAVPNLSNVENTTIPTVPTNPINAEMSVSSLSPVRETEISAVNSKKRQTIQDVLEVFKKENEITSLNNGDGTAVSDAEVLIRVWRRINQEANGEHIRDLESTLVQQLLDMIEEGATEPVCITGRISRLMSCFTLCDVDEELARPEQDTTTVSSEMFSRASRILDEAWREEALAPWRDALNLPQEVLAQLRTRLETSLRAEYADLVSADELNTIIAQAIEAI
jgi:hypothetical protein